MKVLYNDTCLLSELGISPLTGEACAYSMRILCDLNEDGLLLVRDYFGWPQAAQLSENWNSQVNGKPAVASIMLHRDVFPSLVVFALFRKGYRYVAQDESWWHCTGFNDEDIEKRPVLKLYLEKPAEFGKRLFVNPKATSTAPSVGSRNVHAFSGRVE